jgi:catechol 2,3-dioxygenase-like lactoylglutathione lyase family enzyme
MIVAQLSFRLQTICIDCADAHAMADFYGQLLGWEVTMSEPNWVLMRDPAGATGLSFQAESCYRAPTWPEQPNGQDKMLHLDIRVDDLDAAVEHAIAAGARLADDQPQDRVRVLLDPAGHPFCLFLD